MKKMKTNLICVILMASLGCLLWSCKKTENNPEAVLDKNLLKSPEKYAALMEKRTDGPGSFTIEDIKRNGDVLTISVKGGCKEEDFNIVWDGSIAFSSPGQVNLVLNNTSESDCGLDNQFSIKVNLSKIVEKHDPEDFIFNVANGSMKQDKSLNPNGSVTSK
jgi:hypothetical protein